MLAVSRPRRAVRRFAGAVAAFAWASTVVGTLVLAGAGIAAAATTRTRRLEIENRRMTITVRSPAGDCVAHSASLAVSLRATTLSGRHVIHARLRDARLYLDRGVRHTRHVRRHGHGKAIVTYAPDATVRGWPAHRTLALTRLRSGRHVLRISVDTTQSIDLDGRRESQSISHTARFHFRVC